MEKIGQTLAKQLCQSRTDLNELTQAILADKEIADFITSNGFTQEQINRSLPKFNQFMVEREKFQNQEASYVAKGYKPALSMNEGYADVIYLETRELVEAKKRQDIKNRVTLIGLPTSLKHISTDDIDLGDFGLLEHRLDCGGDVRLRRGLDHFKAVTLFTDGVHALFGDERSYNDIRVRFHLAYTSSILFTASFAMMKVSLDNEAVHFGKHDQCFLRGAEICEHADDRLGLVLIHRDVVDDDHLAVCNLGRQSTEQRDSLHTLIERYAVAAGIRAKRDTAVCPLRSTGTSLSCTTGTLLLPGLLAAAGYFRAGQRGLRALSLVEQKRSDCGMEDCFIDFRAEHGVRQSDLADFLARHINNFHIRHCMFLLPLCFDRVADEHDAVLGTRNGALDGDQILFAVDLYYFKIENGNALVTILACHLLVLEDSGRAGVCTHGTGLTVNRAYAVCHSQLVAAPSLNNAGISVSL